MSSNFSQLRMFGLPEEAPGPVGPAQVPDLLRELADRLPDNVRLGTSSWAFPGWRGLVYDREASFSVLAKHGLAAYARHPLFDAVGVDRTYYAPMSADELAAFGDVVGAEFRFLIKAHESLTVPRFPDLPRYGARRGQGSAKFLDPSWARDAVILPIQQGLGPRAGPILFQFSPLDLGSLGGVRGFVRRLAAFLAALPPGPLYAVELRNAAVLGADYAAALTELGVVHCLNVHPTMPPLAEQIERLGLAFRSAPAVVVRWMLGSGLRYQEAQERYVPFDRLVDADSDTRAGIARLALAEDRRPVHVIINNKAEGSSPQSVFALAAWIAGAAQ